MHLIAIIEILAQIFFIHHAIQTNKPRHWILILLIPWVGFILYFIFEFSAGIQEDQGETNSSEQAGGPGQHWHAVGL